MTTEQGTDRKVFRISGTDREAFLQGLVTNDVSGVHKGLVYAALLSPQGKYLADFFLAADGDSILLDVDCQIASAVVQRLNMYKLRADVQLEPTELNVERSIGDAPSNAHLDPRHAALGWRKYVVAAENQNAPDWTKIRVENCIPATGIELLPNETYILEAGFERLSGVDFKKGCYVGQEVTARMKHKTELRKGLVQVEIDGEAPIGSAITASGKPVGTVFSQSAGRALAFLRFDRAQPEMSAGDAVIRWNPEER